MANPYATARSGGRMPPHAPSRKMGAWKLAYADFLTALCAFFLVMWMINTPQNEREGLAEFFSGQSRTAVYTSDAVSQADQVAAILESAETFRKHAENISITPRDNRVRIDLYDTSHRPLFANGDAELNAFGSTLTRAAGRIIAEHGWQIAVEGHTDSTILNREGYSNWELSADRANIARRLLQDAGIASTRFVAVTGLSDTKPLFPDASHLPANRRISIVIHLTNS